MADAWRVYAGVGEAVIEPCRGPIAEVGAERLVDRGEHLEQDEDDANGRQRRGETRVVLHRCNQHAHGNRKHRRQHAAKSEDRPPGQRERTVGLGQDGEELPLLAGTQS